MKKILPVIFILSLVGCIVLSFFVSGVASDASKKRKELAVLKHGEEQAPILADQLLAKSEELEFLKKAFPEKKDFVSVVSTIDNLAAATGVLVDFHFESEEITRDANGEVIVPVKLTIEGDYANIVEFIKAFTNSKYFFTIQSIEGDSPDGIKGKNKLILKAHLYASTQ